MAITYDMKVRELDKAGNYSVTATVTDDTRQTPETISVLSTRFDTEEQKKACWDNIKAAYLAQIAKLDVITAIEAEAKAYLEK